MNKPELLKNYLASRIITFGKNVDGYDKLYYQTNEDLVAPVLEVDFRDKDVFSVVASGDHIFTSRMLEARRTDGFDKNYNSLYYFYLRLWALEQRGELYPNILDGDNEWLDKLLWDVKGRNEQEQEAKDFFSAHTEEDTNMEQLFFDPYRQPEGRTLFTKPEELKGCLSPELTFYYMDLFQETTLPRSYDIAMVSNILERAGSDERKMQIAYENLQRIVRNGGAVICSDIISRDEKLKEKERRIFEKSFDFEQKEHGYIYTKRTI